MIRGVHTAMITPFLENGQVDEARLRSIVEEQIQAGIDGLVPVGTTGESPTVTHQENIQIVRIVIDQAAGRVPVIAGTGSNSTQEAIEMTAQAKELGAFASLQVSPYYNKPNQDGLYRHFTAIGDAVDLPMVVYNIPGRCGVNIETDTLMELAKHRNIVAVKEASGSIPQFMDVLSRRPKDFAVLSGDDNLAFSLMALGGEGVISVASNLVPGPMVEWVRLMLEGDFSGARALFYQRLPLFKAMFWDTNPIPVKYAMSLLGKTLDVFRLPMTAPSEELKLRIKTILIEQGLL